MSEDWSRAIFREEAEELLSELETTLLELEENTADANLVNRVFRALHTIKGSGAMFGFDEIADFTHDVETLFDRVRAGELVITRPLLDVSFKARDHIRQLLDESLSHELKEANTAAIRSALQEAIQGASCAPVSHEPGDQLAPLDDGDDLVLLEGQSSGEHSSDAPGAQGASPALCTYHINIVPRSGTLPDGYPLEPLFEELENIGDVEVVRLTDPGGGDRWEVSVTTNRDETDVRDIFFFADVDLEVTITCSGAFENDADVPDLPVATADHGQTVPSQPVAPVEPPQQGAEKNLDIDLDTDFNNRARPAPSTPVFSGHGNEALEHPSQQPSAPLGSDQANSLRVAANKLDKLVDLVGELVIVQSQLAQYATDQHDGRLTNLSEGLDRLVEELRETTLSVRMIPIGTTFSKFRRLIRDLNAELDKEVEFVASGAETELDKTVIERLSDPLIHLLRNGMDHGIETPEERVAAGKPREGTIFFSAEHSGGEILIRMKDDGRGVDLDAVRRIAEMRGLIEPEEELGERELMNLLFRPGFSTASRVTNLSGRGVGLDVVAQAITHLRGTLDIASERGKGTTFTIRLPLTLAIIDGLQVRSSDEYYVVPLTQVHECVELVDEDRREADGSRILDLRGEIVPYLSLREWFEIPGSRPAVEQIVIATVDEKRVGLVVDEVVGEYQTVIKTLGQVYQGIDGISGATIRGDGTIALILDIPGLVRCVTDRGACQSS